MRESKVLNEFEYEVFKIFCRNFAPLTKNQYLIKLDLFKEFLNNKDLIYATKEDCQNFMEYLKSIYTKSTCEKIFSYLHSFYNFLKKEMHIKSNPFRYVEKPNVSRIKTKDDVFSIDEIDSLIKTLDKVRLRDKSIVIFLVTTGCLVNELVSVKWSDLSVDYEDNFYLKLGKNKKERIVKAHPSCVECLLKYKEEKNIVDFPDEFIFTTQKKESITDRNVRIIVRKILDKAGFPTNSSKDFRHSFAAISLRLGADYYDLKKQLGWRNTNNVLRYQYVLNFVGDSFDDKDSTDYFISGKE